MKTTAIILLCLAMITLVALAQEEEQPVVIKKVEAMYPQTAKDKGIGGKVDVRITIDTTGMVTTAFVLQSDNELLNEAALNAIVKWEFKPPKKEMKATIPFKFKLAG